MENRVKGFYESTMEQAADAVKSQPVAVLVAALGLGVVAGMLVVGLYPIKQPQRQWGASKIRRRVLENLGNISPSSWTS